MAPKSYQATGSAYYPAPNQLEGGFKDTKEKKLKTLQQFLDGKADYVSVAMDKYAHIPYGTVVTIPEIEAKYKRPIEFRVVDTGGSFKHKGFTRIDICVKDLHASLDPVLNGTLTLNFNF